MDAPRLVVDDGRVKSAERLLARIDEVLASGKFKDASEWSVRAGLSRGYLATFRSRVVDGVAKTVKQDALSKLAKAAGVPVPWLMGEIDTIPSASGATSGLESALTMYPWPGDLAPAMAAGVLQVARDEAGKAAPLPESYWRARLDYLCTEAREGLTGSHTRPLRKSR